MDDLMKNGQAGQPMVLCTLANSEVEFYWKYDNEKSSHADMQRSVGLFLFLHLRFFLCTPQLDFEVHFFVFTSEINTDLLGGCLYCLPIVSEEKCDFFFSSFKL